MIRKLPEGGAGWRGLLLAFTTVLGGCQSPGLHPAAAITPSGSVAAAINRATPEDADGNGLPDAWEIEHFDVIGVPPDGDPDEDGLTNRQEYRQGRDPNDFFNGVKPIVRAANDGKPDANDTLVLIVTHPDGRPWAGAPATFTINAGDRLISGKPGGPEFSSAVETKTDAYGVARAYLEPL